MDVFHVLPDVAGSLKFTQHRNICLEHRERQRPRCCTDWSYGSRLLGLFTGPPVSERGLKPESVPRLRNFNTEEGKKNPFFLITFEENAFFSACHICAFMVLILKEKKANAIFSDDTHELSS